MRHLPKAESDTKKPGATSVAPGPQVSIALLLDDDGECRARVDWLHLHLSGIDI